MSTSRIRHAARLAACVLVLSITARAGAEGPILVVKSENLPQYDEVIAAFEQGVQSPLIELEIGDSREHGSDRLTQAAAKHRPRAIYALGARAAYLTHKVLPDTPSVFAMVVDWERYGFDSGPVTGVALEIPVDALFTRFKLMLPHVTRLGVIYSESTSPGLVERAREAAEVLGIELIEEDVAASDEVAGAYRRMRRDIDALWMLADPVVVTRDNFAYLVHRTRKDDVAFLGFSENFVRAGAVLSVSPSYATMGTQSAILLDELLASPSSPPPVQTPFAANLVVNAVTVADLGLDMNASTIGMADLVVNMASAGGGHPRVR